MPAQGYWETAGQRLDERSAMKSKERYFRVNKQQIGYLRFILEGYEGIAALTTVDPGLGQVLLRIPPGCEKEVDTLLADLAGEVYLEPQKKPGR